MIEFDFEGKKVSVNKFNSSWIWDDIPQTTVTKLLPDKARDINLLIKAEQDKLDKAKKLAKAKENRKFEVMVKEANKTGIKTEFDKSNDKPKVTLSRIDSKEHKISAVISWNDKAWYRDSWSHHATDRPWCLEWDYKTIRYKLFNTAFEKAVEKINNWITMEEQRYQSTIENGLRDKEIAIQLNKMNLQLKAKNGRCSHHYIGKEIKKDGYQTASVWGEVFLDAKKPIKEHELRDIIIKGKLSVKDMAVLVRIISTTLNLKVAY